MLIINECKRIAKLLLRMYNSMKFKFNKYVKFKFNKKTLFTQYKIDHNFQLLLNIAF